MKTASRILIPAAVLAEFLAVLFAAYSYYYTDNFGTIDTTKWAVINPASGNVPGLTTGTLISRVAVGREYEVKSTLAIPSSGLPQPVERGQLHGHHARRRAESGGGHAAAAGGGAVQRDLLGRDAGAARSAERESELDHAAAEGPGPRRLERGVCAELQLAVVAQGRLHHHQARQGRGLRVRLAADGGLDRALLVGSADAEPLPRASRPSRTCAARSLRFTTTARST